MDFNCCLYNNTNNNICFSLIIRLYKITLSDRWAINECTLA